MSTEKLNTEESILALWDQCYDVLEFNDCDIDHLVNKLIAGIRYMSKRAKDSVFYPCLISIGQNYLDTDEENVLHHISRDLWKGFVLGFNYGCNVTRAKFNAGFQDYDAEVDNKDDCIIFDEADINNLADYLEWEHGISIRIMKHDEYVTLFEKETEVGNVNND